MPLGKWKKYEFLPDELEQWVTLVRSWPRRIQEYTLKQFVDEGRLSLEQADQIIISIGQREQGEPMAAELGARPWQIAEREAEREARRERAIPSRVSAREPEVEPYGPAAQVYPPFIEGLPTPGMQSYYRQKYPWIFGQFGGEEAMEEAEVGRAEAIARAMRGVSGAKGRRDVLARRIEGPRPTLGGTVPRTQLAKAREQVRGRAGALRGLRERTAKHPFEAFLEKYPFVKEYMKLPMRERGDYPSAFRPQTRWLGW